jgi:phosphoglycerate dehydrogenase-like enzyme
MKVLVDLAPFDPALAALRATGRHQIDLMNPPEEKRRRIDPDRLREVEVLLCSLPPENFADLRSLRWIQLSSTGYSQLFGLDLPARGIRASNSRGCFDTPIAEWNVAMLINLARDVRQMIRHQERGVWDRSARFQREVRGLTVGLWGYGGIGRETARLCRAMGLRVHALTRSGIATRDDVYLVPGTGDPGGVFPDRSFRAGQELEFLQGLDFLVVGMPLTKATDGLIGERELQALPRHAFVLNPARGPIIQEAALLRALREGWIAGAALDTHYAYPLPPEHPLWRMENVILTPHISGSGLSPHFLERVWDIFSLNLDRLERAQPLLNELTPAQLAGT